MTADRCVEGDGRPTGDDHSSVAACQYQLHVIAGLATACAVLGIRDGT
jgi:hypothetical protein